MRIAPICSGPDVAPLTDVPRWERPACVDRLHLERVDLGICHPFEYRWLWCLRHPLLCPFECCGPFCCCYLFPCCGPFAWWRPCEGCGPICCSFECWDPCACYGPFECCGPLECCGPFRCEPCCRWRECGEPSVEAILLARAKQGILTRMQSFSWQIVHGHWVSAGTQGLFLDALA